MSLKGSARASVPVDLKRVVWNLKYLKGYKKENAPLDAVTFLSKNVANNCAILDLGCGRGSLLQGLRGAGWNGHYCGVELARPAVNEAIKLGDQRASWICSDIEGFNSPFKWDAIILISIYYVDLGKLPSVLSRMRGMLSESGFILARIHSFEKHKAYVEAIKEFSPQAEKIEQLLRFS